MRILAFSDLHRDLGRARSLVERSGEVDVVIGAGDFASVHEGLDETIGALAAIETPTVLVPGNNETADALRNAASNWSAATGTIIPAAKNAAALLHRHPPGARADAASSTRLTRRASELRAGATPCAPSSKPRHSCRAMPTSKFAYSVSSILAPSTASSAASSRSW